MTKNFKIKISILAAAGFAVFLFGAPGPKKSAPNEPAGEKIIISVKQKSVIGKLAYEYGLRHVDFLYSTPESGSVFTAIGEKDKLDALRKNQEVIFAEADRQLESADLSVSQITTANDGFFTLDPTDVDRQWYLPKIHIPEGWSYSKGSASIKVAVIDTGIHASNEDLNDGRVVAGYNAITDTAIPANSDSDDNGHGTIVAGLIGAIANNQLGIAGINWDISIMPVKVLNAKGDGDLSVISDGIVWAADHGADIINLSLGGHGFPNSATLAAAVTHAYDKNVLIVAAAGNDTADQGLNLDTDPVYPVCEDNAKNMVLGVAASDSNDRKSGFSNFGINCIDITAPGERIVSTAYFPSEPSDRDLVYASGTSLAAPIVSGVAALIKAQNPSLTNGQIRDRIKQNADNIDALNQNNCLGTSCNGFLGSGRINALLALQPLTISNGTLVREQSTAKVYLVSGGSKQYVSALVISQKFKNTPIINEVGNQLSSYALGAPVAPLTGTLVKGQTDPTVFYIDNGVRRPLTYLVFVSRKFSFADVQVVSEPDLSAIPLADWYWPPDGTLVLIKGNPTVYVMDRQVARPVTYFVFTQRKLAFAKVIAVTPDEFSHLPRPPDTYWLPPLDGTLVKSPLDPTVFVIQDGAKHALSGIAFALRGYKFTNIKTLPEAEINVIAPGNAIFN